jgi:flavin-dependent dehydrogenase
MKTIREVVDVLIAGGGTAGHIAAIQASRLGVKTSVIEAGSMLGGTMTAGGVYMPNHFFSTEGPVVLGIPWELYTKSKDIEGLPIPDYKKRRPVETPGYYSYINIPIYVSLAEEEAQKAGAILHYHEFIGEAKSVGDNWEVISYGRGIRRITKAKEIIDCTGDSDVVRLLGLEVIKSKVRQPGTLQYKIENIEYEQIWEKEVQVLYEEALQEGILQKGDFAYGKIEPFRYYLAHGGHNATHV